MMSRLRDYLIDDDEIEVAFWTDEERHDAGGSRVELNKQGYVVCAATGERIVDMLENGLDVSVYLHPNTAANANWKV